MARIVLLGLGNEDVDVLSRLARLDPCPEVLAVHPDPEALILRLAAVASYPALTEPPRPRPDDIVVVPSMRGPLDAQMVRPWRDLGARIVLPDAPALSHPAGGERVAAVLTGAGVGEREARGTAAAGGRDGLSKPPEEQASSVMTASGSPPEAPRPTPPPRVPDAPAAGPPVTPEAAPERPAAPAPVAEPAPPPASVWDSPEETFRYLAAQTLGPDQAASLWWDGGVGVWVPWVWSGPVPARRPEPPETGIEIPSKWGSFRLGTRTARERVPVNAFARVAEDLALRDLMSWREEALRFAAHGLPEPDANPATLRRWVEPLLAHLGATSALLWKRVGDRYRLLHAAGEGIELSGSLVLPAAMMAATFEGEASAWRRWDPVPWLRMHLVSERSDPRGPLRLRRLELALAGEDTRW